MAARDSQDIPLIIYKNPSNARASQDVTLVLSNNFLQARNSQEVILLIAPKVFLGGTQPRHSVFIG